MVAKTELMNYIKAKSHKLKGDAMKNLFTILFILLFSITVLPQESAVYHVIPPDYASTAGNGIFLSQFATSARTYQLSAHESILTPLMNKQLLAVSWRLPTGASANWPVSDATINNFDIYLGQSVDPANVSIGDFSANFIGQKKLVRSGNLLITANSYTFGNSPNDWGPEISFILDSVYVYTGGNLLIEIRQTGVSGTSSSLDALLTSTSGYGTLFKAVWGSSYTANSGSQGNFSISRITAEDPVPVELTSFVANVSGNNVMLNWTTATELNNYGFEVERRNADSKYETIGYVTGSGTTAEPRSYVYQDVGLPNGDYVYRLRQIDFNGAFDFSNEIEVTVNALAEFALEQNYPNPFNPTTKIKWQSPVNGWQTLKIYDLLGNEVATLINEYKPAGSYQIEWNAGNYPSGVYLYQLRSGSFIESKKMILLK